MIDARDQMRKALKDLVLPRLRELGFEGSFPHLRRRRVDRADLFTFQFDRHGGGFIERFGQTAKSVLPYVEQAERMFDDFAGARKIGRAD